MEMLRNIARWKLRSFLTILGIVIGILALTTMGSLAAYFNALLDGGVKYYQNNITIASDSSYGSVMTLDTVSRVESVNGVAAAFGDVMVTAKPGTVSTVSFGVPDYILGSQPGGDKYTSFPVKIASGRGVDQAASGEVVLGSTFAAEFDKKVGDTIALPIKPSQPTPEFVNHVFKVVGIAEKTNTAPDTGAFVTLTDAQMLLSESLPAAVRIRMDTSNIIQGIIAYGKPGVNLDQLADRITAEVPGVKATRPSELVASFKSGGAVFTSMVTGAALLAIVIGGLAVLNTMIMAVTERTREIGLQKALGAKTGYLVRQYLSEAVTMGVIGGLVGIAIGAGLTVLINAAAGPAGSMFLLTPGLVILAMGFAVLMAGLAGLLPAVRAARLDPVIALRSQ